MKKKFIDKGFKYWLVQFGIFWFILVYGFMKIYGILENGVAYEFQLKLLIKEIVIWICATVLVSWLIWKFIIIQKEL